MPCPPYRQKRRAFSFGVTIVVLAVVFIAALPALKRRSELVSCGNQMHAILFEANMLWPDDDHGGHLPYDFRSMSNDFGTSDVLVCPGDRVHRPATSWAAFTTNNSSYEILAPGLIKSD